MDFFLLGHINARSRFFGQPPCGRGTPGHRGYYLGNPWVEGSTDVDASSCRPDGVSLARFARATDRGRPTSARPPAQSALSFAAGN